MSDPVVADLDTTVGSAPNEQGRVQGPVMVPRPQLKEDEKAAVRVWTDDVRAAGTEVLSTLCGRDVQVTTAGEPPVAFTVTDGRWVKADIFIPTGALSEPGQAMIVFSEREATALVDLAGGGEAQHGDEGLELEGQQLLEEVFSQVVGVLAREGSTGTTVTWGGLDLVTHADLADILSSGSWAVGKLELVVDGNPVGPQYAVLCRHSIEWLTSLAGDAGPEPEPVPVAQPQAGSEPAGRPVLTPQGGGGVVVQSARFGPLDDGMSSGQKRNLDIIVDVPLQLTVELGRTTKRIRDVLTLGPGAVVELDRLAGEAVDVLVNGKLVAKGEVVVIDENFGVRITDIISPIDRVSHVG